MPYVGLYFHDPLQIDSDSGSLAHGLSCVYLFRHSSQAIIALLFYNYPDTSLSVV